MSGGATRQRFVVAVTGLAVEARIAAGPHVLSVASGGDPVRLRSLLEGAMVDGAVGIISFGLSGGLSEHARPGRVILAQTVLGESRRWVTHGAWTGALHRRLGDASVGDIAGSDTIVATPAGKRALHQSTRALVVDNESHVAADIAARRGLPFAALRIVADPATRALPPATLRALRPDGGVDRASVMRSLARSPGQLPGLIRVAVDASVALRALSRSRRRLGPGLGYPDLGELVLDMA
ncbi:MAG TPA: phosphorylase [Casimicrobiaceae bacterium]|nr:phosphorylase [Casimicrobiaceae bacterium]